MCLSKSLLVRRGESGNSQIFQHRLQLIKRKKIIIHNIHTRRRMAWFYRIPRNQHNASTLYNFRNIWSDAQKEIRRYFLDDGWMPPTPPTPSSGADYRSPVDPSLIRNAPMATAVWSAGWFECVPPLLLLGWLLFLWTGRRIQKEIEAAML